jgi:hypothetical protein
LFLARPAGNRFALIKFGHFAFEWVQKLCYFVLFWVIVDPKKYLTGSARSCPPLFKKFWRPTDLKHGLGIQAGMDAYRCATEPTPSAVNDATDPAVLVTILLIDADFGRRLCFGS